MTIKHASISVAAVLLAAVAITVARAEQGSSSDAAYISAAMSAAPPAIAQGATIIMPQKDGTMRTVRQGSNQFTCMVAGQDPMCADKGGMDFVGALVSHKTPPSAAGFIYMLAGDHGTSNTDPYATAKTATNHWVQTGPHVMIVGASVKTMTGYPRTADADPTKPYVMWPGTPYEHLMIPVK
jgi:hypothetical protein